MLKRFSKILDELSFKEEKLRTLQLNFDDNYEVLKELFKMMGYNGTQKNLDTFLTHIVRLEMEIRSLILKYRYTS